MKSQNPIEGGLLPCNQTELSPPSNQGIDEKKLFIISFALLHQNDHIDTFNSSLVMIALNASPPHALVRTCPRDF